MSEAYAPGWEAFVDGEPARIHVADYLFKAVALEAGEHSVLLRYRPDAFATGARLSGLGAVLLLVVLVWPARRDPLRAGAA